jgi:hypothetical protein
VDVMEGMKKRYTMLMLGPKRGRSAQVREMASLLRESGASWIEISDAGVGRVVMRPDLLRAAKKAKAGAKIEALLRPDGARTLYAIVNGQVLRVTEEPILSQFQQKIQQASNESWKNFRYVDITERKTPTQAQPAPIPPQALPAASDEFRAAVKRGMRGTRIVEDGMQLSVAELRERGWVSSSTE